MPPKKHLELATILIDRNETANTSALSNINCDTDFEASIEISDLLLSRKIFSQATDLYSCVLFGSDQVNVLKEFSPADFNTIIALRNEKPMISTDTSFIRGIEKALELFKQYSKDYPKTNVAGRTIFLLSNLKCADESELTSKTALKLASMLAKADADLIVGSPDITLENKNSHEFKFMQILASQCSLQWISFSECYKRFSGFNPKETQPRGQPFELEVGPDVKLKVQMYVKNTNLKPQWKYMLVNKAGRQLTKRFHFTTQPEVKVTAAELDKLTDEEVRTGKIKSAPAGRIVDKANLIKGYAYGKDYVPVTELDMEDFVPKHETKQLKLIQFAPKENILPQYIMSEARYFLPYPEAEASQKVLMELVKDLIAKDRVAICRYAYSAAAHPKVAVLIPKMSKSGVPVFIHYILPFGDEVRNFEFPLLEDTVEPISEYQQDAMDEFVDNMMLGPSDYKLKHLPDPKILHECQLLKQKALDPHTPLPGKVDIKSSIRHLDRPQPEKEAVIESLTNLAEAFPLQIDPNTKATHFVNRILGQNTPMEIVERAKKEEK
ncbi:unnamed protein product [Bursaphelenchus xylophilus]|uniref:(pine wood nematode) hypothetical protein n=1 Tax=Bursaphelenchus xylophilus TaxID=6326 RepID=A0A1I7SRL0_BURXY|nr:unnamed protein product [Bursaphelenchus xylophilus]CAG9102219.1 unnamed protein product [Bursaphelenchus xylophilus]